MIRFRPWKHLPIAAHLFLLHPIQGHRGLERIPAINAGFDKEYLTC